MYNFTPEDLISYLYKETTAEMTVAIEEAIANSWAIREKLEVLKQSMVNLDTLVEQPRTEVILSVLNYVRKEKHIAAVS